MTVSELLYISLRLIGWRVGLISVVLTGLLVGAFHLLASARTPVTVEAYILFSFGIVSMNEIGNILLSSTPQNKQHCENVIIKFTPFGTEMILQLKHQTLLITVSAH